MAKVLDMEMAAARARYHAAVQEHDDCIDFLCAFQEGDDGEAAGERWSRALLELRVAEIKLAALEWAGGDGAALSRALPAVVDLFSSMVRQQVRDEMHREMSNISEAALAAYKERHP